MNDYQEFPPVNFLFRLLKMAPREALIYLKLWGLQNDNGFVSVQNDQIRKIFQITPTIFRNALTKLDLCGFVTVDVDADRGFLIYLYGANEREF